MPPDEGDALHAAALAAAAAVPGAPFVEIGSYCGRSTIWLGAAARHGRHRACSPSTTTAGRRRTSPAGSGTTRRSSTPAIGRDGHAAVLPRHDPRRRARGPRRRRRRAVARRRPPLVDAGGAGVHRRRPRRRAGPRRLRRLGAARRRRRHAGHPRRLPRPGRRWPAAVRGHLRPGAGERPLPPGVGHRLAAHPPCASTDAGTAARVGSAGITAAGGCSCMCAAIRDDPRDGQAARPGPARRRSGPLRRPARGPAGTSIATGGIDTARASGTADRETAARRVVGLAALARGAAGGSLRRLVAKASRRPQPTRTYGA